MLHHINANLNLNLICNVNIDPTPYRDPQTLTYGDHPANPMYRNQMYRNPILGIVQWIRLSSTFRNAVQASINSI